MEARSARARHRLGQVGAERRSKRAWKYVCNATLHVTFIPAESKKIDGEIRENLPHLQ